jgi:hypothetical protein
MIIKDAQLRIADAMKRQSELEPSVKEYHEAYMKLNDELVATKEKIREDNELLRFASERFNDIKTGKDFRVLRSESHDQMKPREKRKLVIKYRWTQMAISVLSRTDQYMTRDALWEAMIQGTDIPVKGKKKFDAMDTCIKKCKKFHFHKDLIGLDGWETDIPSHYKRVV